MSQTDFYAEWEKLCNEHSAARDAYFRAFAVVNQKFMSIGQGISNNNPTIDELAEFEKTWKHWENVKTQMTNFANKYA